MTDTKPVTVAITEEILSAAKLAFKAGKVVEFIYIGGTDDFCSMTHGKIYIAQGMDNDGDLYIEDDEHDRMVVYQKTFHKYELVANKRELDDFLQKQKDQKKAQLLAFAELYLKENKFKQGDLIQWKVGMLHCRAPEYGQPAVVMSVLMDPIMVRDKDYETNHATDILDITIGIINAAGYFEIYFADSRRFEPFAG